MNLVVRIGGHGETYRSFFFLFVRRLSMLQG